MEEIYQKKTQLEHILLRPDTYVGQQKTEALARVYDKDANKLVQRQMSFVPGLYKIFDEILVNATDNKVRDPTMVTLRVDIDQAEGVIRANDGNGIPVEMPEEGVYVPELIRPPVDVLQLRRQREEGHGRAQRLRRQAREHLQQGVRHRDVRRQPRAAVPPGVQEQHVREVRAGRDQVYQGQLDVHHVQARPAKFNMTELEEDTVALMCKVYDAAGNIGANTKIFLNGERLKVKGFSDYVDLTGGTRRPKIYQKVNDRWEVRDDQRQRQFQQCSFVNGIAR